MPDWVLTVALAVIAAIPGLLAIYSQRGKDKADVAEKYEAMAARAAEQIEKLKQRIDALEKQIDTLEAEVSSQEKTINEWQSGIKLLINQLVANGHQPVWEPAKKNKQS